MQLRAGIASIPDSVAASQAPGLQAQLIYQALSCGCRLWTVFEWIPRTLSGFLARVGGAHGVDLAGLALGQV